MRHRTLVSLVSVIVALAALAAVTVATAADDDGDKVVFTVGLQNDYDTLNPVVGVEVPDYEVWNLQYATLTDKAAADFATIPGLAESWVKSNGGKTYTYTLREGLTWSDGTPLTAKDVAFTVNRGREEAWLNYEATVANLKAVAKDDRTVEITSSVPDPKLPTMDVYILPEHIWGKLDAKAITKAPGTDGVGSGPFTLKEAKRGQFWTLQANPGYWGWEGEDPPVDEVVFRLFTNGDAMVAALESGEIDAVHDVPAEAFKDLEGAEGIVTVNGEQGGFAEISVNGGRRVEAGRGDRQRPPGALRHRGPQGDRPRDRQADADRPRQRRHRPPGHDHEPVGEPGVDPGDPRGRPVHLRPRAGQPDPRRRRLQGHERQRRPRGQDGKDIVLDYVHRSDSQTAQPNSEFVTGWLKEIGIGTTVKSVSSSRLVEIIGKGDYDLFEWGWTPFVDPDPMLSYFTCDQLSSDPEDPTNYYNDANWCSETYDAHYKAQNQELDKDEARRDRARDADGVLRLRHLQRPRLRGRPAGLPHRPLRGLAAPARRDRPGALLEHVADVREPDADRVELGRRRHPHRGDRRDRRRGHRAPRRARRDADPPPQRGRARVTSAA